MKPWKLTYQVNINNWPSMFCFVKCKKSFITGKYHNNNNVPIVQTYIKA